MDWLKFMDLNLIERFYVQDPVSSLSMGLKVTFRAVTIVFIIYIFSIYNMRTISRGWRTSLQKDSGVSDWKKKIFWTYTFYLNICQMKTRKCVGRNTFSNKHRESYNKITYQRVSLQTSSLLLHTFPLLFLTWNTEKIFTKEILNKKIRYNILPLFFPNLDRREGYL